MKRSPVLLLMACGFLSQVASAQETTARAHLDKGIQYAYAGDTVLAFAALDRALEVDPGFADAHYFLGRLYRKRASAMGGDFKDRLRAEDALLEAIRLRPDDPRYVLELGLLRLKQGMKPDASRLLERSLEMAETRGDPEMVAEIHFNLGYLADLRYQGLRHQRRGPMLSGPPVGQLRDMPMEKASRYVERFMGPMSEIEDPGAVDRDVMVEHYREALRHDPGHVRAATRLMGHLYDESRLNEYYAIARKLVAAEPENPKAHLFLGLGLHALGREERAARAFDRALAMMTPKERQAIASPEVVLRREEAERYRQMSPEERAEYDESYWRVNDPLMLTSANERRLEHMGRVAYADLRFGDPSTGQRGWETDQGKIFIRYGFPENIGSFSSQMGAGRHMQGMRRVIWSYGKDGPVLAFDQRPGYVYARFAGDYDYVAENYRHAKPAEYDEIPSISEMLPVELQVARFRGANPDEVAVEVHAELPIEKLTDGVDMAAGEIDEGMFILNGRGDRVLERRSTQKQRYAEGSRVNNMRTWRVIMPEGGPLVVAVEARDPLTWRAATGRETFKPVAFEGDTLAVSDILVADVMRPRVEEPRDRDELEIIANPALEFRSGDRIHVYYELYNLEENAEGYASYEVSLGVRVKGLDRRGGIGELLGGIADAWGLSPVGDDHLELRYRREVKLDGRDRAIEYLTLDPNDVPTGEYEIGLRVWDHLAERLVSRNRTFHVVPTEN